MNVLALDCACVTGWATLINGNIRSGIQNMRGKANESAGMKYLRFDSWLKEMGSIGIFDVIFYEKPHHLPGNAIESMNGFITGIHRYVAAMNQIPHTRPINFQAVSPGTIKKFATGKGNTDKTGMMAWFTKEMGRKPLSSDEADAYALLLFACNELGEKP
jgi:hypothetical protein